MKDYPQGAPTYDFAKLSRNLHEIKRIWAPIFHDSLNSEEVILGPVLLRKMFSSFLCGLHFPYITWFYPKEANKVLRKGRRKWRTKFPYKRKINCFNILFPFYVFRKLQPNNKTFHRYQFHRHESTDTQADKHRSGAQGEAPVLLVPVWGYACAVDTGGRQRHQSRNVRHKHAEVSMFLLSEGRIKAGNKWVDQFV